MAPTSTRPSLGYGLSPEMGMFVVAGPATSFHHETLIPDAIPSSNASIGVIPLFNVSGDMDGHDYNGNRNRIPIHLWQQNQHQTGIVNNNYNYSKKTINFESSSAAAAASSGATATCQDCGNQAKKDCPHRRCRTCCKSRGLDCSTHVKSTWVPAARRRERRMVGGASSGSTSGAKKPRMISSSATATSASNSVDTGSSGHQDGSSGAGRKEAMPTEVKAPAVFKCVRVTAVGGGEDEFAYQAMVKIGGHVFKGLLYDKGAQQQQQQPRDGGFPNLSELHLGGVGGSSGGGGVPMCVPTEVYGGGGGNTGGFLGSSIFGNTMS